MHVQMVVQFLEGPRLCLLSSLLTGSTGWRAPVFAFTEGFINLLQVFLSGLCHVLLHSLEDLRLVVTSVLGQFAQGPAGGCVPSSSATLHLLSCYLSFFPPFFFFFCSFLQ